MQWNQQTRRWAWGLGAGLGLAILALGPIAHAVDPGWSRDTVNEQAQAQQSSIPGVIGPVPSQPTAGSTTNNGTGAPNAGTTTTTDPIQQSRQQGQATVNAPSNSGAANDSPVTSDQAGSGTVTPPQTNSASDTGGSRSTSGGSNSHKRSVHYSQDDLREVLDKAYAEAKARLADNNDQRVKTNDANGASKLLAAYQQAKADIKSGHRSRQDQQEQLLKQKTALQRALSDRLAQLQQQHDQAVHQTGEAVNQLADDHHSDADAIGLQDQLFYADYNLGKDSQKAYQHYDQALTALGQRTKRQAHKSKAQLLKEAKQGYAMNLRAVGCQDPHQLDRANAKRVRNLHQVARDLASQIDDGKITQPSQLTYALAKAAE